MLKMFVYRESMSNNYKSIDLMKFMMALCVVTIHTYIVDSMEPSIFQDILYSIIRSAVPFFFITSAYFVMQRNEKDGILKYWKRIFRLYLSWSVINFISVSLLSHSLCIENVQTYIYQFFFNGYGVLWYLWGILIALPLLIKQRNGGAKPWCFLVIAVFAYLFNRAYTHYGSMENPGTIWSWAVYLYQGNYFGITNLCFAITYFSIGSFFSMYKYRQYTVISVALIILGSIMMHFETHKDVALGVPVIAFGLFPLIKEWQLNLSRVSFKWLRKMSTLIYFVHIIIITCIDQVYPGMDVIKWGVIIASCIFVSALLLALRKMKYMSWIARLY